MVLSMATRLGARAMHLGEVTGSIEAGKRADLILVDLEGVHNRPHFERDPEGVYSRIVYAAKASDVTDVMVEGRWLLRDRKLLTIDLDPLLKEADDFARRVDAFLVTREGSLLSKLVAIEGAVQEESYEVQVKVRLPDPGAAEAALASRFEILRRAHYHEFDTYFTFADESQGRLRYREDEFVEDDGTVSQVRYRLTLTGPAAEREYEHSVLLSRSRFLAPATHSLRFYREYFKPEGEIAIAKDRRRWLIHFRGEEFFVNLDRLTSPAVEGAFLEVKSRTWSRHDAEEKARLIVDLLRELGATHAEPVTADYPDITKDTGRG
jgi:5-methylthioadenosine/S-adenosylhomocysteine deaminase